jgi:hypothetical protein
MHGQKPNVNIESRDLEAREPPWLNSWVNHVMPSDKWTTWRAVSGHFKYDQGKIKATLYSMQSFQGWWRQCTRSRQYAVTASLNLQCTAWPWLRPGCRDDVTWIC